MVELWKVNMTDVWHRPPRHILKEMRRKEADERAAARAGMTPQQKLEALDKLLGEGQGARKERAKLQRLIDQEKQEKEAAANLKEQEKAAKEAKKAVKKASKKKK